MDTFASTPEGFLWFFIDWFNKNVADFDVKTIVKNDAYVVWFAYVLGNAKCLISTTRQDHKYYELTYNVETNQIYVDQYVKLSNTAIQL